MKIKTKIIMSVLIFFTVTGVTNVHSEQINSFDCTEEEVMAYASKDDFEQPLGVNTAPSTREFEPAHTTKDYQESGKDPSEPGQGCPNLAKIGSNALEKAQEAFEDAKNLYEDAKSAVSGGTGIESALQSAIESAINKMKEEANKGVCQRIASSMENFGSEVMWDVIDDKYGIDEDAYNDGNRSTMHSLVKHQNRKSGRESLSLLEQMGAKDQGDDLETFLNETGMDVDSLADDLGIDGVDDGEFDFDDAMDEMFGS